MASDWCSLVYTCYRRNELKTYPSTLLAIDKTGLLKFLTSSEENSWIFKMDFSICLASIQRSKAILTVYKQVFWYLNSVNHRTEESFVLCFDCKKTSGWRINGNGWRNTNVEYRYTEVCIKIINCNETLFGGALKHSWPKWRWRHRALWPTWTEKYSFVNQTNRTIQVNR